MTKKMVGGNSKVRKTYCRSNRFARMDFSRSLKVNIFSSHANTTKAMTSTISTFRNAA